MNQESRKAGNKLINCRACQREISPNASRCPHCGEPTEKRDNRIAFWIVFSILIMIALVAAFA